MSRLSRRHPRQHDLTTPWRRWTRHPSVLTPEDAALHGWEVL